MQNIRILSTICQLSFVNIIRTKIIFAIAAFVILFAFVNIILTSLFSWDLGKVSIDIALSGSSFINIILLLYLCMMIFVEDIERQTIYFIIAKPVTFTQYCLGKYAGIALFLLVVNLILAVGTSLPILYINLSYPVFISPEFTWGTYYLSFICQFFGYLVILAITFFWFAFAKQTFVALMLSILSYFVCQNLELLRKTFTAASHDGNEIYLLLFNIISWIFPNLSFFNLKYIAGYGLQLDYLNYFSILGYGIACIAILLSLTIFYLKKNKFQ